MRSVKDNVRRPRVHALFGDIAQDDMHHSGCVQKSYLAVDFRSPLLWIPCGNFELAPVEPIVTAPSDWHARRAASRRDTGLRRSRPLDRSH
jgi:hypothetical protein